MEQGDTHTKEMLELFFSLPEEKQDKAFTLLQALVKEQETSPDAQA